MSSTSLKKFSKWLPFVKNTLSAIPDKEGLYILRINRKIGRLKGNSDILYIGKSTSGLRSRLSCYFKPGKTQYTSKRVYSYLRKHVGIRIAFVIDGNPRKVERRLIQRYFRDHEELPPLNRAK